MRTHPTPAPALQLQMTVPNEPPYANPNAPSDTTPTNSPGVPQPPINVSALGQNQQVLVTWDPAPNAGTYSIYRGLASGAELAAPIASALTKTNFIDTGLTNGTTYYYQVVTVTGGLTSKLSREASATPTAPPP